VLKRRYNKSSKRIEWALVSVSTPGKVLEWYGTERPGEGRVAKSESRVQYFKHMDKHK